MVTNSQKTIKDLLLDTVNAPVYGEGTYNDVYRFADPALHDFVLRVPKRSEKRFRDSLLSHSSLTPLSLHLVAKPPMGVNVGHAVAELLDANDKNTTGITINYFKPGISMRDYLDAAPDADEWKKLERYIAEVAEVPHKHFVEFLRELQILNREGHGFDPDGDNILLDREQKKLGFVDIDRHGQLNDYFNRDDPESVIIHIIGEFFPERRSPAFTQNCRNIVENMVSAAEEIGFPIQHANKLEGIFDQACQYTADEKAQMISRIHTIKPSEQKTAFTFTDETEVTAHVLPQDATSRSLHELLKSLSDKQPRSVR